MGAWAIGGGSWWGDSGAVSHAIHTALDASVNLIDTAPVYGFGHSEEVVGQAIKAGVIRSSLRPNAASGWGGTDRGAYYFDRDGRTVCKTLQPDSNPQKSRSACAGNSYIDLYQTHWPSLVPDAEPIRSDDGDT